MTAAIVAAIGGEVAAHLGDSARVIVPLGIVATVVGEATICVRDGVMGAVVAVHVGEVAHD